MGYSIAWVAFKNVTPEVGLARLGLYSTGRLAPYAESEFTGHALRDGWFLVVARGGDHPLVSAGSLAVLSEGAEAVACSVEEHVMCSSAERWVRGQNVWRIAHDAQQSIRHLKTTGALPSTYPQALREAAVRQDAEDAGPGAVDFFFEVPLQVAKVMTGFKHDEAIAGLDYARFPAYAAAKPRATNAGRRKWWQIWK